MGAKFSGPQWLQLECVLGACFSGPITTTSTTTTTTTFSIVTITTTAATATATVAGTTTTTTTTSQSIGTSTTSTMSGIMIAYTRSETGLKHSKCFSCVPFFPLLPFAFLLDSSELCCYLGKKIVSMMSVPAFLYCFMSQIALAAIGSPFGC